MKNILQNPENLFWVSKISLFEVAIKMKIGKLPDFKIPLSEFIKSVYLSGYEMLPVKDEHLETYNNIDFGESHRDPFDRYLLAAAHFENLAIITKDEKFGVVQQNSSNYLVAISQFVVWFGRTKGKRKVWCN